MADMTYKKFQKQENSMKSLKSFSLYLHAMTSDGKNTNHKRIPTKRKDLLAPTGALIVMMVWYISKAAAATFSDFQSVH